MYCASSQEEYARKWELYYPNETGIAIVCSQWHSEITEAMEDAAKITLLEARIPDKNIRVLLVAGAYELPLGVKIAIAHHKQTPIFPYFGVIALGCVIRGATDHNVYINHAVSQAFMQLMLNEMLPIGYGIVTASDIAQANARIIKGKEAAEAVVSLLQLMQKEHTTRV